MSRTISICLRSRCARAPIGVLSGSGAGAASTGEEPYSLAITAHEVFGANPPVQILASDLDTNVLAHGQKGIYSLDRVERLGTERLHRFFLHGTHVQEGHVKVKPELQRILTFRQINLLEPNWPLRESFDAVFFVAMS